MSAVQNSRSHSSILIVFNFVIAAPVAAQDVHDATADTVDGGEDVKIVSGKRAQEGKDSNIQQWLGELPSSWPSSPKSDRWSEVS
jgi:hypothetical protein